MGDNDWSTLFIILIMVAVMVGAYLTTRFLTGKAARMLKSKHIQVIDRIGLAKDKALFLTKVGNRCFFIGVTNQTINKISEIEPEELNIIQDETTNAPPKKILKKFSEFVSNAKNAPENLRKARELNRQSRTEQVNRSSADDDYIEQINRAIKQRKQKTPKNLDKTEDSE